MVGHQGGLSSAHPSAPGEKWCVKFVTQCENVMVKFTRIDFSEESCVNERITMSWDRQEELFCDENFTGSNWMDEKVLNGTTFALEFVSETSLNYDTP